MNWLDIFNLGTELGWFKESKYLNYDILNYDLDVYYKVSTSDVCDNRTNSTNKGGKD